MSMHYMLSSGNNILKSTLITAVHLLSTEAKSTSNFQNEAVSVSSTIFIYFICIRWKADMLIFCFNLQDTDYFHMLVRAAQYPQTMTEPGSIK